MPEFWHKSHSKYAEILENHFSSNSTKNETKIYQNASLDHFRRQIAPGWAPGAPRDEVLNEFGDVLDWKIGNRFKSTRLRIDRHLDPLKMTPGMWFGINMNIWWKIDAKMGGFWWLGTTFGVILFAYFTLSQFLKKFEKSMPNGTSKVIVCAGRRPPHPWEETGESVLVGRYLGNGENGEPA